MPRESRGIYTSSTTTRVLAAFYTDEANGYQTQGDLIRSDPRLGHIIGFSSKKSLGQAAGTWSLTIKKPRQTPQSQLRKGPEGLWRDPEDVWVRIKASVDGKIVDTVFGLIDSISEDTTRSGAGVRSETYTITGRDVGKVFEATELFVNFFHDPERPLRSMGAVVATFMDQLRGTPAHFVRVLVETWLGNDGTAEVPWLQPAGLGGGPFYSPNMPGGSFNAKLALEGPGLVGIQSMGSNINGEAIAPTLMQIDQSTGHLWDTMQEYSNGVMNEMFVDLAPAAGQHRDDFENLVPTLTLRERPFPTRSADGRTTSVSKWHRLRSHTLERGDIKRRQISKGGASNRFNYWKIRINGMGTEGFGIDEMLQRGIPGIEPGYPGNIPIFSADSISRHGVRPYTATSRFVPIHYQSRASAEDGEIVPPTTQAVEASIELTAAWLKKLHDWYVVAPLEFSGTLTTTRMQPEIRIGQRVREELAEGAIDYYVETVANSWTYSQGGQTVLTVTRGEYVDDDLLGFVYGQYDNPRALTAQEACLVSPDTGENDEDATTELLEQLSAGCRFGTRVALARGEDQGLEIDDNPQGATQLEVERDGRQPRPPANGALVGEDTVLDDSMPDVGSAAEIPPVDAPADPADTQGQLERQEPLAPIEGLDDLDSFGGDPIGGLGLDGTER